MRPLGPAPSDLGRAAGAGLAGSAAYVLAMWMDLRLVRYRFDDFTLLGRPFSRDRRRWRRIGAALHLLNGSLLALPYAALARFLPGPGWVRGLIYGQLENLALWPVMLAVDRYHPARKEGELDRAWSGRAFLVAVLRHAAYGLVLGLLYGPDADAPALPQRRRSAGAGAADTGAALAR